MRLLVFLRSQLSLFAHQFDCACNTRHGWIMILVVGAVLLMSMMGLCEVARLILR